ncbi:MAG TPA: hypothetical protein VK327_07190, partial [Candidatus Paceibacterota bacterium]|nr:hypothetical protein [Candidatus Paceibacterota bacterium]
WLTRCIPLPPQLNSQQRAEACKDIGRQVMQRFQSPDCEIEIVARQDVNATSVQIGVIFHYSANWSEKGILTTRLNGQEWQVFYNR